MKTLRKTGLWLAALAAAGLLWTGTAHADDEATCPVGKRMGRGGGMGMHGGMHPCGQEGMQHCMQQGRHRTGEGMQMRERMMEEIPGAEEEMETHRDNMHDLKQEAEDLRYEIRKALRDAETEEARDEILEAHRGEVEAMVGKMFDERQRHQEAMLKLKGDARDTIVEGMADRMLDPRRSGRGPRGQGGGENGMHTHGQGGPDTMME